MLSRTDKDRTLRYIESIRSGSFTFRDVVRFLDLDSDDRRSLQRYLDELDADGIIRRVRRGTYALPKRENLVAGVLHCHRDGYGFLVPEDRSLHGEDVFIPGRNMEGALHGDRVYVRIERKKTPARRLRGGRRALPEKIRVEGAVVRILARGHTRIVGRYCAHPRFPFVTPLDPRMFRDIRIPFHESGGAQDGQIVAVDITQEPGRNRPAQGRVRAVLGHPGDPGIEYAILEHKYGLPTAFSPEASREASGLPDHVLPQEYEGREDFRGEVAVTIDGETARDFDDAVSLRTAPGGHFLLGVHIADVSHYVRPGGALDLDAYARGTSVYYPDRAIPMLPPKLSSGISSLRPGVDRLVLSAILEIDGRGNVLRSRFARGVLRSRARMTYAAVAGILRGGDSPGEGLDPGIAPMLRMMQELSTILYRKRFRRGAVDFDLPEADIRIDAGGRVLSVLAAERNEAHRIIEEFMLAANECAAGRLQAAGAPALFRIHEDPDPAKVEEFALLAAALGYPLERRGELYGPKDFQDFVGRMEGKPEQKYLLYLMLRSFMQARYSEENTGHFGLATEAYTHFTSPIRRYPDLCVHRLLKASLDGGGRCGVWADRLPEIARHVSERERVADEAEREMERIKKAQFMAGRVGGEFAGIVTAVSRQGLQVELFDHYVEGFVPMASLVGDDYRYSDRTRSLRGSRRRNRYAPGSRVRVRLDNVDMESARLLFSVLGP